MLLWKHLLASRLYGNNLLRIEGAAAGRRWEDEVQRSGDENLAKPRAPGCVDRQLEHLDILQ